MIHTMDANVIAGSVPPVSVVMPLCHAEQYVDAFIESVLPQTLGDLEVIVIEDGSTDRSP